MGRMTKPYDIDHFFRDGSAVRVARMRPQTPLEFHSHRFHELVLILKGSGVHFTDTEEYVIQTGDAFLIKPNVAHGYRRTDALELVNVLFLPERLGTPPLDLRTLPGYHALFAVEPELRRRHAFGGKLTLSLSQLRQAERLIAKIEDELTNGEPGNKFMAMTYFLQLQGYLSRNYTKTSVPKGEMVYDLSSILAHMERHFDQSMTLDALAKMGNMSKSTLNRLFKKTLGRTPIDYLTALRIDKARDLLEDPATNVTEASYGAGFDDANYFSRKFRSVMGVSPREFKQNATRRHSFPLS